MFNERQLGGYSFGVRVAVGRQLASNAPVLTPNELLEPLRSRSPNAASKVGDFGL
jgi:hypothetical protein